MADKKIILLTGQIQTGKTTTLAQWANKRTDAAGILTPVINNKRQFLEIPGGYNYNMEAMENEFTVFEVGRFKFSTQSFEKATSYLLKQLQQSQWQYIIIDEVGPLELKQEKGFWPVMNHLLENKFSFTPIIVVRQDLCSQLAKIFETQGYNVEAVNKYFFC